MDIYGWFHACIRNQSCMGMHDSCMRMHDSCIPMHEYYPWSIKYQWFINVTFDVAQKIMHDFTMHLMKLTMVPRKVECAFKQHDRYRIEFSNWVWNRPVRVRNMLWFIAQLAADWGARNHKWVLHIYFYSIHFWIDHAVQKMNFTNLTRHYVFINCMVNHIWFAC